MKDLIGDNLQSLIKYVRDKSGTAQSFGVPSDIVESINNADEATLWRIYNACDAGRAIRILVFQKLVTIAQAKKKDGVTLASFFKAAGRNYDTERKFVYRELEEMQDQKLIEASGGTEMKPTWEDTVPRSAGDEEATSREDIDADDLDKCPETDETPVAVKEKKPCFRCGQKTEKIEKLEKLVATLKQEKRDLVAENRALKAKLEELVACKDCGYKKCQCAEIQASVDAAKAMAV